MGRWLTGTSSPASMVDGGGRVVAHRPSLAMASPGERHTSSMVTTRICLGYLGFGWKHRRDRSCAWWCGGESTMALSAVFNANEAMARHEVITEAR